MIWIWGDNYALIKMCYNLYASPVHVFFVCFFWGGGDVFCFIFGFFVFTNVSTNVLMDEKERLK